MPESGYRIRDDRARTRGSVGPDLADSELHPFPLIRLLIEPGDLADQGLPGVEALGDLGIDAARDITNGLASPAQDHRQGGADGQTPPQAHARSRCRADAAGDTRGADQEDGERLRS